MKLLKTKGLMDVLMTLKANEDKSNFDREKKLKSPKDYSQERKEVRQKLNKLTGKEIEFDDLEDEDE